MDLEALSASARRELEAKWAKTEAATWEQLREQVQLLELLIELFRSGFNNLHGLDVTGKDQRLRVLQLNTAASFLEVGYQATYRGYYQPALACARALLEHFAIFLYVRRFPTQASQVLNGEIEPAIRTGLECHPDAVVHATLVDAYSELSRATHPRVLSLALGVSGTRYRVNSFDYEHARAALGYLLDTGYRVLGVLGEEIHNAQSNPAWITLANDAVAAWHEWHREEAKRLGPSPAVPEKGLLEEDGRVKGTN